MSELRLIVDTRPTEEDLAVLDRGLSAHANDHTARPGFRPLAVWVRDRASGELVGGVFGRINWTWLYVSKLWVHADRRGSGLGSRLIAALEEHAIDRGCTRAHLDTFTFQAEQFYAKHGYATFAALDDYPPGHRRVFMQKTLAAPASAVPTPAG